MLKNYTGEDCFIGMLEWFSAIACVEKGGLSVLALTNMIFKMLDCWGMNNWIHFLKLGNDWFLMRKVIDISFVL